MPTTDAPELLALVDAWWQAVADLCGLLDDLDDAQWSLPTDLAGWDVRACAAHVAHLESRLAGAAEETAELGETPHVTGLMGLYTEIGVVNRRGTPPAEIVAEIRRVTAARHDALLADPPTDADAIPPALFGGIAWSWRTLLSNRVVDVWMHGQDVRRAVDRPGDLHSAAADHTVRYLGQSLGYVLGKKVGAEPGTSLVVQVGEDDPIAFLVGEDRRARPVPPPADPTVALRTDRETFVCLVGGRRPVEPGRVAVEGDRDLGERVLTRMAVTP